MTEGPSSAKGHDCEDSKDGVRASRSVGYDWSAGLEAAIVVSLLATPRLAQAQFFGGAVLAQNFQGAAQGGRSPRSRRRHTGRRRGRVGHRILARWDNRLALRLHRTGSLHGSVFSGSQESGFEAGDKFLGHALASATSTATVSRIFAIGVPYEDHTGAPDGGCVHILYGATGVRVGMPFRQQTKFLVRLWWNGFAMIPSPAANEAYGYSLAAADFNRDGKDDLVIGAPGATINGQAAAGAVYLMVEQRLVPAGKPIQAVPGELPDARGCRGSRRSIRIVARHR